MSVYPVVFPGVAQLGEFSLMVLCRHAQQDDSCVHVWYVWMLI